MSFPVRIRVPLSEREIPFGLSIEQLPDLHHSLRELAGFVGVKRRGDRIFAVFSEEPDDLALAARLALPLEPAPPPADATPYADAIGYAKDYLGWPEPTPLSDGLQYVLDEIPTQGELLAAVRAGIRMNRALAVILRRVVRELREP